MVKRRLIASFNTITTPSMKDALAAGRQLGKSSLSQILVENSVKDMRSLCPYCFGHFGEATCLHWVWTFAGPVYRVKR